VTDGAEIRPADLPREKVPGVRMQFEARVGLAAGAAALVPLAAMLALGQGPVPLGILLVATVPTAMLAWWVARRIARRVRLLAVATSRVAQGDLSVRVRPRGNDEVDALMRAFNAMVEEMQQSRSRIAYLQRIGAWQQFAQRLAHEIKNPLTPIQLAIQEVAKKYDGADPAFAHTLATAREVIEEEVETLRRLVAAFTEFGRLPDVKLLPGDLSEFVRDAGESHEFLAEAAGTPRDAPPPVHVEFATGDAALPVRLDRILLRRVLDNLVKNAVQAGARNVWVRAESHGDAAALVVDDDGPGVPESSRAHVFDPYFTTRQEGTGLGLAIVRKIALDHGGDVAVEGRAGGGARFVVMLPTAGGGTPQRVSLVTFRGVEPIEMPPAPGDRDEK
jgi:nitrogen fixation/metabolism regulation signal transduction histidine kinase